MLKKLSSKYYAMPIHLRAAFWFLVCAFLQKGATAVITPLLSRLLSTTEYGEYSVFNSWLEIVTIFVSLKLSAGVYTQGVVKFERCRNVFSSSLQGLSVILTLIWMAVYLCFQNFWNQLLHLTTVQMLMMMVMIWATNAFTFWSEEQRVNYHYRSLVGITLLVSVARPVLGVICVLHANDRVTAWILGILLAELLGYVGPFFSQMIRGRQFFSKKFWKYALLFNIPLIPHYLSQTILNSSDRIMIERMIGTSEAGIYSLAYTISRIMTLFSTALNQTIGPWLYQKIRDKKVEDISRVAYPCFILIAVLNIMLIAFAPEVISLFAPASYHKAVWIIPPVSMSVFFLFAYSFFANFEFYYEKRKYITLATVGGAILNILLNYIFIPLCGYYAAGYTTLFCYLLYVIFHYCFMRRICNQYLDGVKVYDLRVLGIITVSFCAIGFLLMTTYNVSWLRYGIIVFMVIMLVIKKKYIIDSIRKLINIRQQKR